MASGYSPDGFVWVYDRIAGLAYPIRRDHFDLAADPDRYEIDEQHAVTDSHGVLLESKPITSKASEAIIEHEEY